MYKDSPLTILDQILCVYCFFRPNKVTNFSFPNHKQVRKVAVQHDRGKTTSTQELQILFTLSMNLELHLEAVSSSRISRLTTVEILFRGAWHECNSQYCPLVENRLDGLRHCYSTKTAVNLLLLLLILLHPPFHNYDSHIQAAANDIFYLIIF